MRRFLLIVLISLAYVACAHHGKVSGPASTAPVEPHPVPPPEERPIGPEPGEIPPLEPRAENLVPLPVPRHGGHIRVVAVDASIREAVVRSNTSEGLTVEGLLLSWRRPRPGAPCWLFEISRRWLWQNDGVPLLAEDVLEAWERGMAGHLDARRWLLEPFGISMDASGRAQATLTTVRSDGRLLEVCPSLPAPDLPLRLRHPALAISSIDPASGLRTGPGPFVQADRDTLVPNERFPDDGPYVDRVELLDARGPASLLLKLGDAHLAVVYGSDADALLDDPGPKIKLERLPAWDRTYWLWCNPTKRWINDPYFRYWLSRVIDRDDMVTYLFDGRAERAFSISRGGSSVPLYPLRADRPLSPLSEPRLRLAYDRDDPFADTVARRVQAVLETHRVDIVLEPAGRQDLLRAVQAGDVDIALLAHRPAIADPVLSLLGSVWWLGDAAKQARQKLVDASRIDPADVEERAAKAWAVERSLLEDARAIPLIRLQAWLAHHSSLTGVAAGPDGVLRLEEAWWLP